MSTVFYDEAPPGCNPGSTEHFVFVKRGASLSDCTEWVNFLMRELLSRLALYIICLVCGSDPTGLGSERLNIKHLEVIEHVLNEDLATREREALKQ